MNPEIPSLVTNSRVLWKRGNEVSNQTKFTFQEDPMKPYLACEDWVVVSVSLNPQGPLVIGMETKLLHFPLYFSGLNATYVWVDQIRQGQADKKVKEVEKVDLPKF